ncbi:hypothetical protein [Rossellomorea aquimaris]|uniref:hypothetical protein n=1 Tax=Rossellomorea aquimaris TaxID=189382 RepID=UPI0007D06579|nr:hypothetical protein [Rossellomorea aquimaris]
MDLNTIWEFFIEQLQKQEKVNSVYVKRMAGIPFLYIESTLEKSKLEELIIGSSARAMRGKRLHSDTIFFRKNHSLFVYRHRFYVPQEKMFCCGNLCVDCVRLKQ